MRKINFLLALVAMAIFACNQPQGENAEVSDAKDVQEASAEAVEYTLNTEATTVSWIGSKPAASTAEPLV